MLSVRGCINKYILSYLRLISQKDLRINVCVTAAHNWGSDHDNSPGCVPSGSEGGKYLMYPYTVSGLDQNNKVFCACFLVFWLHNT